MFFSVFTRRMNLIVHLIESAPPSIHSLQYETLICKNKIDLLFFFIVHASFVFVVNRYA